MVWDEIKISIRDGNNVIGKYILRENSSVNEEANGSFEQNECEILSCEQGWF